MYARIKIIHFSITIWISLVQTAILDGKTRAERSFFIAQKVDIFPGKWIIKTIFSMMDVCIEFKIITLIKGFIVLTIEIDWNLLS